jgi:hypothetical protein
MFYHGSAQRFRTPEELSTRTMSAPSADPSVFYHCIVSARAAYISVPAIAALAELAFREAASETDGCEIRLSLFSMTRTLIEHQHLSWRDLTPVQFAESYARPGQAPVTARCEPLRVVRAARRYTFD